MELSLSMQAEDLSRTKLEVDRFNKEINGGKKAHNSLGKDDFLKILITQLQNQDPSNPMKDTESIAQMAQFSAVEQMTNMVTNFGKLSGVLNSGAATNMLGKPVEIADGKDVVRGVVSEVVRGDFPLVMVNDKYYDYDQVRKVLDAGGYEP